MQIKNQGEFDVADCYQLCLNGHKLIAHGVLTKKCKAYPGRIAARCTALINYSYAIHKGKGINAVLELINDTTSNLENERILRVMKHAN